MKIRHWFFSLFSFVFISCLCLIVDLPQHRILNKVTADEDDYTLSFNSSKNLFNPTNNNEEVLTTLGNPLIFSYSGYSINTNDWGQMAKDGYLLNLTAISGLISFEVVYGTAKGSLKIYYGWENDDGDIEYQQSYGVINESIISYNFDEINPSYFKMIVQDSADINTLTIKYSCLESEKPSLVTTTIEFGMYPQTVVEDGDLIVALSMIEEVNEKGYLEYDGATYKKIINPYLWRDNYYKSQSGNITFSTEETYYFKVEPIVWKIVQNDHDTILLLCDQVLSAIKYYPYSHTRDGDIHSNNYEYSSLRAYLNGYDGSLYDVDDYSESGFIKQAFNDEELSLILLTTVDNSVATTKNNPNEYVCLNTQDKIFSLSYLQATSPSFGFINEESRLAVSSDYARATGTLISTTDNYGCAKWWLRSPCALHQQCVSVIGLDGIIEDGWSNMPFDSSSSGNIGIRPALYVQASI